MLGRIFLNVLNVRKPSPIAHLLPFTSEFILAKSHINARNAGKLSNKVTTWLSIVEHTLERSCLNVRSVRRPSGSQHTLLSIRRFTRKRNPMSVRNVGRLSGTVQLLLSTRDVTVASFPTNAVSVGKPSGTTCPLSLIFGASIPERNLLIALIVGKLSNATCVANPPAVVFP